MNIPAAIASAFQSAQSDMFEDSSIDYHAASTTTDAHNSKRVIPATTKTGTLSSCSVDEGIDDMELTAWGLKPGQAIVVRYSGILPFAKGTFIKYSGRFYRVEGIQPATLYQTAYCSLWIS